MKQAPTSPATRVSSASKETDAQAGNGLRAPLRTTFGAGALGAIIASACCIPAAAAVALGLSLGTAAALAELLTYRPLFVAAGLGLGVCAVWLGLRNQRASCTVGERRQLLDHALTRALLGFVVVYVAVNQLVVPLLYNVRWLVR